MAGIIERSIAPLASLIAFALFGCGEAPASAPLPRAAVPVVAAQPAPPNAVSPPPAAPETTIVITRIGVAFAGGAAIYALPGDASEGAEVAFKVHGPRDYFVVPLGEALAAQKTAGRLGELLGVVVDPDTPFRVLSEVLVTAGQSGSSRSVVRESVSSRTLVVDTPKLGAPNPSPGLHLLAIVVADGVSLKAAGGNIAPGCSSVGAGLTSPRIGRLIDLAGLRACAVRIKAASPDAGREDSVTIMASAPIPVREVFDVADALRGSRAELFPKIQFGLTN